MLFNDPAALPRPVARAVRMAIGCATASPGGRTAGSAQARTSSGFGVGIAHGYATLGQIGFEGRFDYAAIGRVANLASRLCDEAGDGEILVSEEVRAAATDAADTFALGAITLKGFAASVNAYEV